MLKNMRAVHWLSAALLCCGLGAAGCGSGGSGSSGGVGTMSVHLSDAPNGMKHVWVSFDRVEASGPEGWTTLWAANPDPQTVDLTTLCVTDMQLASAQLPAGHYNQVRLMVSKVEVEDESGNHFQVTVPSGAQTGIKINVNADVPPNAVTELLLDFNVDRSIHATPPGSTNYSLKPVIPAVVKVMSGTLTGAVTLDGTTPAVGAKVEVYPDGTADLVEANMTNSSVTQDPDGTFKVWALMPGSYLLQVTSADGTLTKTFIGVTVTAGQDTALGPLSLAP
jgi:Domain of unknown function (DUF4382)/Carboxypeptidase regulatory-like domain